MTQPSARPDRTLIAVLSFIAALVLIALVVVFSRGGTVDVDPATPEGVVQSYTRAIVDNDYPTARDFLSTKLLDNCERNEPQSNQGLRMTVISSDIHDTTAVVKVGLEYGGGSFGGSGYEYDDAFSLVKEGSDWKIETTPWDLALCYNGGTY